MEVSDSRPHVHALVVARTDEFQSVETNELVGVDPEQLRHAALADSIVSNG